MYNWLKSSFKANGQVSVDGLVYNGLGISLVLDEVDGRLVEEWQITNLATGATLGTIGDLDLPETLKIATMIADGRPWPMAA